MSDGRICDIKKTIDDIYEQYSEGLINDIELMSELYMTSKNYLLDEKALSYNKYDHICKLLADE